MASPGMMQSGLSRQLFEAWCTDKRNGVIVAGYCVEGTLAKVLYWQQSLRLWLAPDTIMSAEFGNDEHVKASSDK